ncbi:hypothetical protein BC834DRAFT_906523 [Gloeopeniophorella convolvens]|nr:hypothetical protein BC834DRAFT_906523 [Gloeopeniophorella convolvens]
MKLAERLQTDCGAPVRHPSRYRRAAANPSARTAPPRGLTQERRTHSAARFARGASS